jgi:hypothetical protein
MFQKFLAGSRSYSFINKKLNSVLDKISNPNKESKREKLKFERTYGYLKELKNYVEENDAELVVLLIPSVSNMKEKGGNYLRAKQIFDSLSIQYIDPINLLSKEDYVQRPKDDHWNNKGHQIIGQHLSEYFLHNFGPSICNSLMVTNE